MLWDLIRDFFVQHVFGGVDSNEQFFETMIYYDIEDGNTFYSTNFVYKMGETPDGITYYVGIGDWLSTTATIITISIIVVLCCLFVYKIIKLVGGLIR